MATRRWTGGLVLGVLLSLTVACWPVGDRVWPRADSRPEETRLEVRNQNFNEVVVYLMPDGLRQRVGMVSGLGTETFELPRHRAQFPGGFRLLVSPIGSRETYVSETVYPGQGDTIVLTVTSRVRMSHWHLR